MPWEPKCCSNKSTNITSALNRKITLYGNTQNTVQVNGKQSTSFPNQAKLTVKCYIVDKSIAAQETAINQNIQNVATAKEFICDYFNLYQYNITKLVCDDVTYEIIGKTPYYSYRINGTRYDAPEGKYFVGILAGIKEFKKL